MSGRLYPKRARVEHNFYDLNGGSDDEELACSRGKARAMIDREDTDEIYEVEEANEGNGGDMDEADYGIADLQALTASPEAMIRAIGSSSATESQSAFTLHRNDTLPETSSLHPSESASQVISTASTSRKASWVWKHFRTEIPAGVTYKDKHGHEKQEARHYCQYLGCRKYYSDSTRQGSLTNMSNHLNVHGIMKASAAPKTSQQLITSFTSQPNPKASLEENLLNWVITDFQPFNVLENPAFQKIFSDASLSFPPSSARTIRRRIEAKFIESRASLMLELKENCVSLALSLDCWTSNNGHPILAIVGYYVDKQWACRRRVLEFMELQGKSRKAA